ncbi:MAG: hypothetical protein PHT02_11720 [Tissierellia bacterium]|nr:hypothetical protein [Tissierellia bacterium]
MSVKFEGNKLTRVFSSEINSIAYATQNAVLTGCGVTVGTGREVNIDSGKVFFGVDNIDVSEQNITLDANATAFNRLDLIVVNSSGVASIVKGTPAELYFAPDYDPDDYVILAQILVTPGITQFTSDLIKDLRTINSGGSSGSGGSGIGREVEKFTSETTVNFVHNLGDVNVQVQVYNDSDEMITPSGVTIIDENEVQVNFSSSTSGKIIVLGGVSFGNAYYTKDFTSSTTWSVTHNLGNKYVQVQCIDSSDNIIEPQSIELVDEGSLEVTFGTATAGRVIVTGGASFGSAYYAKASEVNANFNQTIKLANERAIANGAVELDTGSQKLIDIFSDSDGANGTVDTSNTDANNSIPPIYESKSFDATSQMAKFLKFVFKPDGTKLYILSLTDRKGYQYSLSTAWDISTASYDSKSAVLNDQDSSIYSLFFKPDGTKLYVISVSNPRVYQYGLSTAWDISTASYDSKSYRPSNSLIAPINIFFKSDGAKLYILDTSDDTIYQYGLSTAWDISTASYDSKSFSVASQDTGTMDFYFKSDGAKLYILGNNNINSYKIYQYSLSTDWDISTATYDSKNIINKYETICFKSDGSKLYLSDNDNSTIYQFKVSPEWDIIGEGYSCKGGSGVDYADSTLQSNSFTIPTDATKVLVTPYKAEELETGDTITADVSTDNGSTYSTDIAVNEWVDISSLTNSGTAIVKMNLGTNTGATTPKIKGWCALFA